MHSVVLPEVDIIYFNYVVAFKDKLFHVEYPFLPRRTFLSIEIIETSISEWGVVFSQQIEALEIDIT